MSPIASTCRYCKEAFESRSALFRHIRSSEVCFQQASQSNDGTCSNKATSFRNKVKKRKVAIQFGYYGSYENGKEQIKGLNHQAATIISRGFFRILKRMYPLSSVDGETGDESNSPFTLASGATKRHPSLLQEETCNASADVIGLTYRGGTSKGIENSELFVKQLQIIVDEMVADDIGTRSVLTIQILGLENLGASGSFHAETSCTQRTYQYLMPSSWIDDSKETREWICSLLQSGPMEQTRPTAKAPASLIELKRTLKLVESRDVTKITPSSQPIVSSPGRYQKLWKKERRPFHNFCDPDRGSGSMTTPSNKIVWRSVDKCQMNGFIIDETNGKEPILVIEIRGDDFVPQQVRRIIATVVSMTHGWLPKDFFAEATRCDITIETPIAPAELIYCGPGRFHFIEQTLPSPFFSKRDVKARYSSWLSSLQSKLLEIRARNSEQEMCWLQELKSIQSERLLSALREQRIIYGSYQELATENNKPKETSVQRLDDLPIAPIEYDKTLSLLQAICNQKKWPRTSDRRSRFLRSPGRYVNSVGRDDFSHLKAEPTFSEFRGQQFQCGAFTLVNPEVFQGKVPGVNAQFPELVEAVFELEAYCRSIASYDPSIEKLKSRGITRSTHCMVNRNVEYTPHYLLGEGKEGCSAMIVGLGDYTGGEFILNGIPSNIRYNPLCYNGWRQIHSTKGFRGERISLIWFSPALREDFSSSGEISYEDFRARNLVEKHNQQLALYSPLRFRPSSTDALVIHEIMNTDNGCDYEMSAKEWSIRSGSENESPVVHSSGFNLEGHEVVLDIGAHIGVFSRHALSVGCKTVLAYEPESENAAYLEANLQPTAGVSDREYKHPHRIYTCAVAHGEPGLCNLVNARNRNDGTLNSWRHSLEKYSSYVNRDGGTSVDNEAPLAVSRVDTIPFFGQGGALCPGVTFVKMDCEGAEIDILLSADASKSCNWLDVTHLVFEWSFTKERRVMIFHKSLWNLRSAGFEVVYEGQGSWWDTEPNSMWPYHTDLIVFARK